MNITLEYLKSTMTLFAEQAATNGFKSSAKDEEPNIISSDVYALMEFLEELLLANRLVHRFDYQIRSKSISESLDGKVAKEQFKAENYTLPFLHHLAIQDDNVSAEDLQDYISSFLLKHADLLSIHDVVVLKSGATRAVTNIRFAVNSLRKNNLIESRSFTNKRSLEPTLLGILSLIFLKISDTGNTTDDTQLLTNGFIINKQKYFSWELPWVISKSSENPIDILERFIQLNPNIPSIDKIRRLVVEFHDIISHYVVFNENNGAITVKANFHKEFNEFIISHKYNWGISSTIHALREGYRNLWENKY